MAKFDYKRPTSLAECLTLLKEGGDNGKIIAGGTDLLVEIRAGKEKDLAYVVDVTHIADLKGIAKKGDKISVKPGTSHDDIVNDSIIAECAPFLADASHTVGSPQIRNAGTIGGSVGTASPASDPAPVLIALNGVVTVESKDRGARHVLIEDFILKPYKTDLAKDEIMTDITVDNLAGYKTAFVKLGRRKALAIARMNVAVALKLDGEGKVEDIRIVPGSAFPVAKRIKEAEAVLLGQKPTEALIEKAGDTLAEEMVKVTGIRWSTEYKEPVIASLTKRAIRQALEVK